MKPEDDPEARIRELERPLAETARASEVGGGQAPSDYSYPTGSALPPATAPPSFGSPSPWTSPRSTSPYRVWWILAAFFIIGTIAIPLGLAVLGINRASHGGLVILSPTPSTPSISSSSATPPAAGPQAPAPAPSLSPVPSAGANLSIGGIKENRTITCNDSAINISGISNKFVITGHCASLNVSGVQNSVTVDAVDTVEVSGFNNQITYHTGSPSIDKSGDGNVVQQG
jgi:Protein of unknown function (DUF3060)